ncbi:MAG: response regulator [Desulfomonilaceae bacterium]
MNGAGNPKAAILVIDDEQIVHESVRRILEDEGYKIDGAMRVDQALGLLSKHSYDIVLTDLMMPDKSGMEAVQAIAENHPLTGVVMFTGFATVDSAVESMKLGALDYLPKPFTPEELVAVIERALEKVTKKRRDKEIESLYTDAEMAIKSSLDLKEVLRLICTSVAGLFNVKGASLLINRQTEQTLEMACSCGLSDEYLQKGALDSAKSVPEIFRSDGPIIIEDSDFDTSLQYADAARSEGIVSILSIPMKMDKNVLGVLRIYSAEKRSFDEDEIALLTKFAEQGVKAIENAMAYESVKRDIDGLKKSAPALQGDRPEELHVTKEFKWVKDIFHKFEQ